MKIIYTGSIFSRDILSSTCHRRMLHLQELGHEVYPFCSLRYANAWGRWGRSLSERTLWGPLLDAYNQDLVRLARSVRPDLLWVDKGRWVRPETLHQVRAFGAKLVHYTPDPALVFHTSHLFRACVPEYDLVVTTKRYEEAHYVSLGVNRLLLQTPMYVSGLHQPLVPTPEERERFSCDAVFVGSYGKGRERYLEPVAELGVDLKIWGNGWQQCKAPALRSSIQCLPVTGRDYVVSLVCAKIGLGLLSPLVPDRSTTRSMEIPAVGTFLLAERSEEHKMLFEEGKEAEYFEGVEELQRKVTYYLEDAQGRELIARAGHQRCVVSPYSSKEMVEEALSVLRQRAHQQVVVGKSLSHREVT